MVSPCPSGSVAIGSVAVSEVLVKKEAGQIALPAVSCGSSDRPLTGRQDRNLPKLGPGACLWRLVGPDSMQMVAPGHAVFFGAAGVFGAMRLVECARYRGPMRLSQYFLPLLRENPSE